MEFVDVLVLEEKTAGNGTAQIEYNTIASIGNFIDFGDLVASQTSDSGGTASSSTRAVDCLEQFIEHQLAVVLVEWTYIEISNS